MVFSLFLMTAHVLAVEFNTQSSTDMESHRIVKAMEKVHQRQFMFTLQVGLKVCYGTTMAVYVFSDSRASSFLGKYGNNVQGLACYCLNKRYVKRGFPC